MPLGNNSITDMQHLGEDIGYPFMLKSRTEAYDGRGSYAVKIDRTCKRLWMHSEIGHYTLKSGLPLS